MTAVNGAFDTVVDAETLEESPPAAEELGSSGVTTGAEHYCLGVKSCVHTIPDNFVDTKSYAVQCEQQLHRAGRSRSHSSNIVPGRLTERV